MLRRAAPVGPQQSSLWSVHTFVAMNIAVYFTTISSAASGLA